MVSAVRGGVPAGGSAATGERLLEDVVPDAVAAARVAARALVESVLAPQADRPADAGVLAAIAAERRRLGLWGVTVPAEAGGRGWSWPQQAALQEECHRVPAGVWTGQALAAGEPPAPLYGAAAGVRERYLRPCLDGRRTAVQVWGADHGGIQGVWVRPARGGVVLRGHLEGVPAYAAADLVLLVLPRPEGGGLDAYLCDRDLAGFDAGPAGETMGRMRLVDLTYQDCFVPEGRVLRDCDLPARRWRANRQAAVLAAGALGAALASLEQGIAYARRRVTFGRPIGDRQAIQWMVADGAREVYGAQVLVARAAEGGGSSAEALDEAVRAKVYATEAACRILDRVIQIHGAYGYSRDLPFEGLWRELAAYRFLEGRNDELLAALAPATVSGLQL